MTRWWRETTIYQVYPRSFADSNADGIGDLRGIIQHLDYLVELGVETVWVSPFFRSPQADFGYVISDYLAVAPEYGTTADVTDLIEAAHARGLRILFDMVMNHTSDQHPWFLESRASRQGPRADWYIWADGSRHRPPNNWRGTVETRSAWQWCEERGQWYLASFLPFQPDLNWHNPQVREAMFGVVRHWLDAGVDGFRLDVFGWIMKDAGLHSNPIRPHVASDGPHLFQRIYTQNTAENVQLAKDLRAVTAAYEPERMLVGEVFGGPDAVRPFLGDDDGLQLVFAFDLLEHKYSAATYRDILARYDAAFPPPALPAWALENHDRSRLLTRVGGDERKARVMAMLLLTARGVPAIYQGQEVGAANTVIPLKDAKDPLARTYFPWMGERLYRAIGQLLNRDEVRTPMPWSDAPGAGFTQPGVATWLPAGPDAAVHNVAAARQDPDSIWHLYRDLLHLRRATPALRAGDSAVLHTPGDVLAYERRHRAADGAPSRVVVVLNMGESAVSWPAPDGVLARTDGRVVVENGVVKLPAHAGAVLAG